MKFLSEGHFLSASDSIALKILGRRGTSVRGSADEHKGQGSSPLGSGAIPDNARVRRSVEARLSGPFCRPNPGCSSESPEVSYYCGDCFFYVRVNKYIMHVRNV